MSKCPYEKGALISGVVLYTNGQLDSSEVSSVLLREVPLNGTVPSYTNILANEATLIINTLKCVLLFSNKNYRGDNNYYTLYIHVHEDNSSKINVK